VGKQEIGYGAHTIN